jgi:hypothetical protein
LIDSGNTKVPCYYLHSYFINDARLLTAEFKESQGRLPTDAEFVSLVLPLLNNPLAAPVALTVSNIGTTLLSSSSVQVSGLLSQGNYGDDRATVWVYWGPQDGGMVKGNWAQSQVVGVNTSFNPATFSAVLTNLAGNTNYSFRFYATNASGEAWAPASSHFTTVAINPSAFARRLKVSFTGYNRGEVLSNFPVLVNLTTNLPGFCYRQFASPTGGDLRFTDGSGLAAIPHEIDEWNTNGTSSVWVSVPQLATTNDFIWMYWGNPGATSPPVWTTNGAVWSPNYYVVYHLKENGFPYTDSAQQHPSLSGVAPGSTAGVISHGCSFNGTSQYLDAGVINLGNVFSLSAWVNLSTAANNIQTLWANQHGGFSSNGFAFFVNTYQTANQKVDFASGDGVNGNETMTVSNAVSFSQWHLLSASVNRTNGTVELFVDGNDLGGSSAVVPGFANAVEVNLGRFTNGAFYFNGTIDEARIAAGARSSNWVWASWITVASNTTLAAYSEVNPRPTLSLVPSDNGPLLTWPTNAGVFTLFAATNLIAPVMWFAATNVPLQANGQWQVALGTNIEGSQFYRLQQ